MDKRVVICFQNCIFVLTATARYKSAVASFGCDLLSKLYLCPNSNSYRWREALVKREKRREYSRTKKRSEKQATKVDGLSVTSDFSSEKCPQSVRDVSGKNDNKMNSLFTYPNT